MANPKVSKTFRSQLSEKLMDLGNLISAGLVFGQTVSGKPFSLELALIGAIGTLFCYYTSYFINR